MSRRRALAGLAAVLALAASMAAGGAGAAPGVGVAITIEPALSAEYVGVDMVVRGTGDWTAQSLTGRTVGEAGPAAAGVFAPETSFTVVSR